MCQATVYLMRNGQREDVMRDVIVLEADEKGVRAQSFFDDPVIVKAQVTRIDFLKHTVTLTPMEAGQHVDEK